MPKANPSQPLTNLQKLAWWSVPVTGAVAVACSGILVWLSLSPAPAASPANVPGAPSPLAKSPSPEVALGDTRSFTAAANNGFTTPKKKQPPPEVVPQPQTKQVAKDQPSAPVKDSTPPAVVQAPVSSVPSGGIDFAAAGLPAPTFLITCQNGALKFAGPKPITYETQGPVVDKKTAGSEVMECLTFNGLNQAICLPDIPKFGGSFSVTVLVTQYRNCIFFDSEFQNMTIRKNNSGIRWRITPKKWSSKIRDTQPEFDSSKWNHIVMTWQEGSDAVLYVNGTEFDRFKYANDAPEPPVFVDVVLGRTRGTGAAPKNKYCECSIGQVHFFEEPLDETKVKSLNSAIRQQHPSFFN